MDLTTIDPKCQQRKEGGVRLPARLELAQNAYDLAKRNYDIALEKQRAGVGSPAELAATSIALSKATIDLNAARYDLAKCQVEPTNDPTRKVCEKLGLDLNRAIELVALRQKTFDLATQDLDRVTRESRLGTASANDLALAEKVLKDADTMLKEARADERDARAAIALAVVARVCAENFVFERPAAR